MIEQEQIVTYNISMYDIYRMLFRLNYDANTILLDDNWWNLDKPSIFPHKNSDLNLFFKNKNFSGMEFFEKDSEDPSIIIDMKNRKIYIFDNKHLYVVYHMLRKETHALVIDFEDAFYLQYTWNDILNNVKRMEIL